MTITVDIETMSNREKISLMGQLWDSIDKNEYQLTPKQKEVMEERVRRQKENPQAGKPWSEIRKKYLG